MVSVSFVRLKNGFCGSFDGVKNETKASGEKKLARSFSGELFVGVANGEVKRFCGSFEAAKNEAEKRSAKDSGSGAFVSVLLDEGRRDVVVR